MLVRADIWQPLSLAMRWVVLDRRDCRASPPPSRDRRYPRSAVRAPPRIPSAYNAGAPPRVARRRSPNRCLVPLGRNAERELERIVDTITKYLDRAETDASLPLSYEGIEEQLAQLGAISRRKEPQILELVARIASLKRGATRWADRAVAGSPLAASGPANSSYTVMTNDALAVIVRREMREVARLHEQWFSRHARSDAHDAPLALLRCGRVPSSPACRDRAPSARGRRVEPAHGIVTTLASGPCDEQMALLCG
jgi:hypothetical protein